MSTRTEDLSTLLSRIPEPEIRSLFSPEFILCCEEFVDEPLAVFEGLAEFLGEGLAVPQLWSMSER